MSERTIAPYGTWRSPISAAMLVEGGVALSHVWLEDGVAYWIEGRPSEGGRSVVVRADLGASPVDVTPAGSNARTKVHEYGGGAYVVHRGVVFSSNFTDQRLYRHDPGQTPTPITPETGGRVRYADGRVTSDGMRMICVRERHEDDGVVNEIVSIPTDGSGDASIVVDGRDFFSTPRISPDGAKLAWLTWDLPYLPWDGSELWVADLDPTGAVSGERLVAGEAANGVDLPTGVGSGRRPALRLGPHRLVEPVSRGRRRGARDLPDGCGVRLATVGVRCLDVRVPRRRPDRMHLDAERRAACLRDRPAHR